MRRPLRLRRTAAALVLPLALATLAACGSESGDEPAGSSAAADPGLETGEEMPTDDFLQIFEEAVAAESTAHVTIKAGKASGLDMEGDMDYSTTPPSSRMTVQDESAGGELEVIQVGAVSYIKAPDQGDKYLKADMSGLAEASGGGLGLDPSTGLDKLESAIKSVTYQGTEDLDGEEMARYSLVLDSGKLLPPELAELSDLPEEATYDVWFDQDGLYRQLESDLGQTGGTVTVQFSDWGKDVSIEAPPADQVMEMPEIPEMPEMPEMPELPEMPAMPSMSPSTKG